ncbi:MAG: hypothetical protein CEN88_116 [Candidatus Berkelbacteria bacterium Licking1014_2]|uniref:Uncharacterized protein n=1 Tax=Candidatus Berkelbacteria bacterium Licking1014_2 TaxID=2017146 RepID=A0A554LX92_9BACT|nr:MAG: hypothetical protein CEN88_116 [Candidatus Berkelbacteria bacterium Licking1014_2]
METERENSTEMEPTIIDLVRFYVEFTGDKGGEEEILSLEDAGMDMDEIIGCATDLVVNSGKDPEEFLNFLAEKGFLQ